MKRQRRATPQRKGKERRPPATGPAAAGAGGSSGYTARQARLREIAAEVAEAVIRNDQGHDPELALSGLGQRLAEQGQADSEFAVVVEELRAILRRRLPGRGVN